MRTYIIIIIFIVAAGIFAGGIYYLQGGSLLSRAASQSASSLDSVLKRGVVKDFDEPQNTDVPEGFMTFTHPTYKFSFLYPQDYKAGAFSQEDGEYILVQKEGERGVQIFVMPFDEPAENLTAERLKQDIPDIVISNSQIIDLVKTKGLYFQGEAGFGKTHEFWFVYQGKVFQLSAPLESGDLVETIISTLKFN
jgi:hypothetical protein